MAVSQRSFSGADIKRFLDAKGVGYDCPACGREGTLTIAVNNGGGELGGEAPAVRIVERLVEDPRLGYGLVLQACNNCGHVRYFRDIEIMAFLSGERDNG